MKISLTKDEAIQLIGIGLTTEHSPFQIREGFAAANIKITAQGNVSFELVEDIDDDEEEDETIR